jgi:hypothetical protein
VTARVGMHLRRSHTPAERDHRFLDHLTPEQSELRLVQVSLMSYRCFHYTTPRTAKSGAWTFASAARKAAMYRFRGSLSAIKASPHLKGYSPPDGSVIMPGVRSNSGAASENPRGSAFGTTAAHSDCGA